MLTNKVFNLAWVIKVAIIVINHNGWDTSFTVLTFNPCAFNTDTDLFLQQLCMQGSNLVFQLLVLLLTHFHFPLIVPLLFFFFLLKLLYHPLLRTGKHGKIERRCNYRQCVRGVLFQIQWFCLLTQVRLQLPSAIFCSTAENEYMSIINITQVQKDT